MQNWFQKTLAEQKKSIWCHNGSLDIRGKILLSVVLYLVAVRVESLRFGQGLLIIFLKNKEDKDEEI